MYNTLSLHNFRGFSHYSLSDLTRINLLVGKNNAGKTSILEAIEILSYGGRPSSLLRSPNRRGEFSSQGSEAGLRAEHDIRYLFHQHRIQDGSSFEIKANNDSTFPAVSCVIRNPEVVQLEISDQDEPSMTYELVVKGPENEKGSVIKISTEGILASGFRGGPISTAQLTPSSAVFLGTEGADFNILQKMWDDIVLTSEEDRVIEALQIIEPKVELLAFTGRSSRWSSMAWIKLKNDDERVPLGSLGDGIRRLLSLAIFAARAQGGILLIDEIDTGLHYSTLEMMWRFIIEMAARLDIQVFATTHSGDCLKALAWLNEENQSHDDLVSVYRVDRSSEQATRYSAGEIELAERQQIEVRG
jgi:AAA15 family ATPase/GTPase